MVLNTDVQLLLNEAVTIRRDLHKIPEAGFQEVKTSEYICRYLQALNIPYDRLARTGVVAKLDVGSKETIAFRADMDALSMDEATGVDFASAHKGFMHGCGHDGHMTMLLLLAKYLVEHLAQLKTNVVFIFQPAEEGPGGAEVMLAENLIDRYKIDEIFGIHLHPDFEEGTIALSPGPVMAMTGEMDIDIYSKSGHGAMPHTAVDSIVIASHLITQFQSIVSRNLSPTEAGVITIGRIEGGERRNIISGHVRLEGTLRAFSESAFKLLMDRMQGILAGLEKAFDCQIKTEFRTMYPPVVNHSSSVNKFRAANQDMMLVDFPPQMISEDFSYYLKAVEGAFLFLGTRNEDKGYSFPLHNSHFNFDESVLLYGVQAYINLLL